MYDKILNTINLLKNEFGKFQLDIQTNTCYEFNINDNHFYMLFNKGAKIVDITYADGSKISTKNTYIFTKVKPVEMLVLNLNTTDVKNEVIIQCKPLDLAHSKIPRLLQEELENTQYRVDEKVHDYLFAYPLREDLAEVLEYEHNGNNLKFMCNGEHVRTVLNAKYDSASKMIYCDSWNYVRKSISSIEKKVQTLPMIKKAQLKQELNDALWAMRREIDSNVESIDVPNLIEDIKNFTKNISSLRI